MDWEKFFAASSVAFGLAPRTGKPVQALLPSAEHPDYCAAALIACRKPKAGTGAQPSPRHTD